MFIAREDSVSIVYNVAAIVALALSLLAGMRPAAAEQISVTHWGVLMYGAPYAVAIEKGFYKEAGLDIDGVLTSKGGGTTMRNVMASDLPYGEVALAAAIAAMKQGIDLKIIHTGVRTAGEILWVTTPDSGINSVQGPGWQEGGVHLAEIGDRHAADHGHGQAQDQS